MLISSRETPYFIKLIIFVYLLIAFNPDLRAYSMLWYSVTVAASLSMLIYLLVFNKFKPNRYFWWLLVFNLWGLLSIFWALNQGYTIGFLKTAFAQMIIFMPLSMLIRNKEEQFEVIKLVVLAILVTSVYLWFNIDRSLIGQTRISEEGWNTNSIGMMTSVAILFCLGIIRNGVHRWKLILYIAVILFLGYISLFSGSRKSLFILMAGIALYYFLTSRNNKVFVLSGISGFIFLSYYLIMSVPELYNVMGIRVEGYLAQITGESVADSSTIKRMLMIDYGISWFKQNPLIGYGMNNYRTLLAAATGLNTYSHNNYIELLVGVGIIGTAIYYYIYAHIIKQLFKSVRKKETLGGLFFVLMIILLAIDYGSVDYNDTLMQLIICLGFVETSVYKFKTGDMRI